MVEIVLLEEQGDEIHVFENEVQPFVDRQVPARGVQEATSNLKGALIRVLVGPLGSSDLIIAEGGTAEPHHLQLA